MTSRKKSPSLTKVLVFGIVALVGWRLFFSSDEDTQNTANTSSVESVGQTLNVGNNDTVGEEVSALALQLREVNAQAKSLQSQLAAQQQKDQEEFESFKKAMLDEVLTNKSDIENKFSNIQTQVNGLAPSNDSEPLSEYDFGYDGVKQSSQSSKSDNIYQFETQSGNIPTPNAKPNDYDEDGFVIVEPVHATSEQYIADNEQGSYPTSSNIMDTVSNTVNDGMGLLAGSARKGGVLAKQGVNNVTESISGESKSVGTPFITIPENTRVLDAVATSTILGRLPRGGSVQDPWEFQVELGSEALAAGGHVVPGLESMRMRGIAIGDPALKCVTGNIFSMTFIFEDGVIHQVGGSQQEGGQGNSKSPIASILDSYATPCIPGKEVGNEGVYAAAQIGATGLASVGDAFAKAEEETIAVNNGTSSNVKNRDAYVASELFAGLGEQSAQLLANRYSSVFNAILVPLGTPLIIEFKQQINIDYNSNGRKVIHADYQTLSNNHHANSLFN